MSSNNSVPSPPIEQEKDSWSGIQTEFNSYKCAHNKAVLFYVPATSSRISAPPGCWAKETVQLRTWLYHGCTIDTLACIYGCTAGATLTWPTKAVKSYTLPRITTQHVEMSVCFPISLHGSLDIALWIFPISASRVSWRPQSRGVNWASVRVDEQRHKWSRHCRRGLLAATCVLIRTDSRVRQEMAAGGAEGSLSELLSLLTSSEVDTVRANGYLTKIHLSIYSCKQFQYEWWRLCKPTVYHDGPLTVLSCMPLPTACESVNTVCST